MFSSGVGIGLPSFLSCQSRQLFTARLISAKSFVNATQTAKLPERDQESLAAL